MNRPLSILASFLAVALIALSARTASAQTPGQLLDVARAQLEDIQPDTAVTLLVRVLDRRANASANEQIRGWTLLGIAELMRNHPTVARQAFRRALERDANIRVDSLGYLHSDLRTVFATERDAYRTETVDDAPLTMTLRMATDTTLTPSRGRYSVEVRPRRRARVVASIVPAGNEQAEPLWTDSATAAPVGLFSWDLQSAAGPITPGRYTLRLTATDLSGKPPLVMTRTFVVSRTRVDTLIAPQMPDDSLLPEATGSRRPTSLLAGVAMGAGALALTAVAGNKDLNGGRPAEPARYVVAGAVSAAAIIGFLTSRQQKPVPENISYNQDLRDRYERLQVSMAAENRRRLAAAPLRIRMEAARMDATR